VRPTGDQAVDAINGVFGEHPVTRAAHARGTVVSGVFTAGAEARRLTRAEHMRGGPVPVTARFSNASGDPGSPDNSRDARGLAVKFHLEGGAATDIVAVTLPCFFVREPEDFVAMNRALRPGPLRAPRVLGFALGHTECLRALVASVRLGAVPSYARCRFNGLHAFRWVSERGEHAHVRYSWIPYEGEARLGRRAGRGLEFDHLQQDLRERLGRTPPRPIRFMLQLQLAPAAEVESGRAFDPTVPWEAPRTVDAGLLELDALGPAAPAGEGPFVFDPTRVTDGIELPAGDAILRFRPAAYAVSAERRGAV
jgi:catalase